MAHWTQAGVGGGHPRAAGRSSSRDTRTGPLRAVLVLAGSTGGIGTHVRSLAEGLSARGVTVTVCGPRATQQRFDFTGAGASFTAVELGGGRRGTGDVAVLRELRRAFAGADVVHAHGLQAGLLAGLARRGTPAVPLVLTLHNALLAGGAKGAVLRMAERRAVRGADIVLGASSDLVTGARAAGARDARLAPVAAPPLPPASRVRSQVRAELGLDRPGQEERPLVVAVGRLAAQKDYPTLLDASRAWRSLDPRPLLAIAGDGPLREELQERIDADALPARLLGHRDDVADLLTAADLVVLTSRWEARALVAQEALRAGVPLVATAVGGIPELVGEAAALVPPGDAEAVGQEVAALLADPRRRQRLAEAGLEQAESWPDQNDTVVQVLSVYDEVRATLA
ncbi:glycosyltransferase family 4 protein [Allostreptomyces psammosilenae]|uniref:Glycosyltransferase involved in cell wall biosynthesis n=1 Tax=Allostreptomyces psammosilenae TaxID=1892865 RepID=A0A852ZYL3_9ACTN|nr:glycosyltransferase family 4 protein [Allostreptomyces psammosilenae]NYI03372.1 glycosyltransferase involved in cell wall biosynthesis [Allostreptomyces psammosilenae]